MTVPGGNRFAARIVLPAFLLLTFLIVTVIAAWPLEERWGTRLPGEWRDRYQRVCDVQLVTWIIDWDLRNLLAGQWGDIWNANIFYPTRDVLAYSEHFLGAALMGAPVHLVRPDPVAVYNVVFILTFVLAAWCAALVALDLTGHWEAAILAGLVFGYCPYRWAHINHLHLLNAGWTPLALLCGRRFLQTRSWASLSGVVAAVVMQCWASLTLGVFLLIMLALLGTPLLWRARQESRRRLFIGVLLAIVALSLTQGPIALKYRAVHRDAGLSRTWIENLGDSADLVGYVAAPPSNVVFGGTSRIAPPERWLFPGIIAAALALAGLFHGTASRRRRLSWSSQDTAATAILAAATTVRVVDAGRPVEAFSWSMLAMSGALGFVAWRLWRQFDLARYFSPRRGDARTFYVLWTLAAMVLSLGPVLFVNGHRIAYAPYAVLYMLVPPLSGVRAPVRFHMFVMLGVSVLAGYGVRALLAGRRPHVRALATLGLGVAILVESMPWPLPTVSVTALHPQQTLEHWLASQSDDVVFAELPIAPRDEIWRECDAMFSSIYHRKRIVNGYSGFFPKTHGWLWNEIRQAGVSDASVRYLEQVGVHYVGVHRGTPIAPTAQRRLTAIAAFDEVMVYRVGRR